MAASLTRSVPSRKRSPGYISVAIRARNERRGAGPEVADRAAEEGEQRALGARDPLEVGLVVADDAVDVQARVLVDELVGDAARDLLGDVDGHVRLERAGVAHRVEQHPALGGGARAELDQRPRRRRGDDLGRAGVEDLALAAGRVVLGQLGDPLEQLGAALVVEVLRRQLLERAGEALADDLGHPGERAALRQVDLDLDRAARAAASSSASLAQRKPAKIWRRSARSQLRKVVPDHVAAGRPGAAAQDRVARRRRRPRSTRGRGTARSPGRRRTRRRSTPRRRRASARAPQSEAPSAKAPGGAAERQLVEVGLDRGSAPSAAASHSNSVGRRLPRPAANAAAWSWSTWMTGASGVERLAAAEGRRDPAAVAVPLPVQRRLRPGLADEGGEGGVGDRRPVDPERRRARPRGGDARCRRRSRRSDAPISWVPPGTSTIAGPGSTPARWRVPGRGRAARSRRPSAGAGASSRCAGARGRSASRRRSRPASRGSSASLDVGVLEHLERPLAHLAPCRRGAPRRAGSAARCGSARGFSIAS